jgi:lipid-A-disaccharide synthase-like uncharacterized protein
MWKSFSLSFVVCSGRCLFVCLFVWAFVLCTKIGELAGEFEIPIVYWLLVILGDGLLWCGIWEGRKVMHFTVLIK